MSIVVTIQQEIAGYTEAIDFAISHLPRIGESLEVFYDDTGEAKEEPLVMSGVVKNVITTIRGYACSRILIVLEDRGEI
jgi:hypothetical protein